jgi:hypothetical protein
MSSGGGLAGLFEPTPFVGVMQLTPNKVYNVWWSIRSGHSNFNSNGIYAIGHSDYRTAFIMPV